jgi:ubiquinone/menaquinone biosynthesis C-methylase UbiE
MIFDAAEYKNGEREAFNLIAGNYDRYGEKAFTAYAKPLINGANLKPAQNVLDVACGTGIPSLEIARSFVPSGLVTGIDLSPRLIEIAKEKAKRMAIPNISYYEMDAENMSFSSESFDAVICSHGLVYTTNREKALREMFRVLAKDGRIAISAWSTPDRSIALGILQGAILTLWPDDIIPGQPLPLDFGQDGVLERALADAGFKDIKTKRFTLDTVAQNADEYWESMTGLCGRMQILLRSIPSEIASDLKQMTTERFKDYMCDGRINIPCEQVMAWARK